MAMAAGFVLAQDHLIPAKPVPGGVQGRIAFFGNQVVDFEKGAAYSADSITETTQTLSDGNRIKNSNQSSFARDNEGRTRRESTIQMLGPVGRAEEPIVTVLIIDPVAKVQYTLDSTTKTAIKSGLMHAKVRKVVRDTEDVLIERKVVKGQSEAVIAEIIEEQKIEGKQITVPDVALAQRTEVAISGQVKEEDLGSRMIEGLNAKGTRITMTIPAGQVGNERPIEVVTETWYSEAIKGVVLSKHMDPRMGETVTQLTNIKLGEPAKSLFEPPVHYKLQTVKNMRMPMEGGAVINIREER
jgi:hypothetical protein